MVDRPSSLASSTSKRLAYFFKNRRQRSSSSRSEPSAICTTKPALQSVTSKGPWKYSPVWIQAE